MSSQSAGPVPGPVPGPTPAMPVAAFEPAPPGSAPLEPAPSFESAPPPRPPAKAPTPARRDRGTQLLLLLAGLVAVAGIAFAVGRVTAPAPVTAATGRFGNGAGNGAFGAFGAGGNGGANGAGGAGGAGFGRGAFGAGGGATVRGTVESVTPTSITIKLASGQTATVDVSGTTTYHRQAAASSGDVSPGSQVDVQVEFQPRAGGSTPPPSGTIRTFTASDITVVGQ